MKKIILINEVEEENELFCEHAKLRNDEVKVFIDGETAYDFIKNEKLDADIVVMDMILSNMSGLDILNLIKEKTNGEVKTIAIADVKTETMVKAAVNAGADFFCLKIFKNQKIFEIIDAVLKVKEEEEEIEISFFENEFLKRLERLIVDRLHRFGIPSNLKGFRYLHEGITLLYLHPDYANSITKKVYPSIAEKFKTTPSKVERAMRHALTVCWIRGDFDYINKVFKYSVGQDQYKPTNSTFLVTVADYIRLRDADKLKRK